VLPRSLQGCGLGQRRVPLVSRLDRRRRPGLCRSSNSTCVTARIPLVQTGYYTSPSVLIAFESRQSPLTVGVATGRGAQESLLGSLSGEGHHPFEPSVGAISVV